jgi:uncharacterized membrane protein
VRRAYIDWLRGVAVIIMFIAHATDAWTRDADRGPANFYWRDIISGFGAPLFLLLAGVAIAYAGASKVRRGESHLTAARQLANRGWQIFGIAFLFRLQMYVTSLFYRWRSLFKVDILNVMGPSIAAAGWTWGLGRSTAAKAVILLVPTLLIPMATPYIRIAGFLAVLPDPLEAYVRPAGTFAAFTLFPWSGFVFAGALIGVLLEPAQDRASESWRVGILTAAGVMLAAGAFAASFLPSPFANSYFWTTSPAFFYLRVGIMLSVFGLAWLWSEVLWRDQWQPFVLLGQTSLFVYWVHVELVYGYFTKPIYRRLPFWGSLIGVVLLTIVMYYLAKSSRVWVQGKRASHVDDWRVRVLTVMGL